MMLSTDYVVGDEDCTFNCILSLIINCSISLTDDHLFKLMVHFNTKDSTKYIIKNRPINRPVYDCLEEILKEWRLRMGRRALLSTLLDYLRKSDLKAIADIIQNQFWPGYTSTWSLQEVKVKKTYDEVEQTYHLNKEEKKRRRSYMVFRYFISFIIAIAIILLALYVGTLIKTNGEGKNMHPPEVTIYQNETTTKSNHDEKLDVWHNQTTSQSENASEIVMSKPTKMQSTPIVSLMINDSASLNELFLPENNLVYLVNLEFNNIFGHLCDKNSMEVFSERIILPMIQNLVLDVSKDCENLLDLILSNILMTRLRNFRFRGHITNEYIRQIHEFMHRYYRTLEGFHIMGILEGTINLFEIRNTVLTLNTVEILNSVREMTVKLDHIYDATIPREIVNDRFCSIFPFLSRFETKNVLISFKELLKLQNCTYIADLTITVEMKVEDTESLNEFNWESSFPCLKHISVNYQFDECPHHSFFEKILTKFEAINKYGLCSNCNLSSTEREIHCTRRSKPTSNRKI